ncbi:uncharacterized protein LOC135586005 isoform X1 [Musa acuminata AAA Group]|uniref:uncharacterized protein LOC135586005 isoform X1 n=1 Tax=Musa acuminata AAA Group TaxID=214697 RepID=UPI0031DE778D
MDRYQRVEKPREETPINENEIRITSQGRMRNYITYATSMLQRRIVDLHQNTAIGSADITDTREPLEEGLLLLETTRHVSVISITLSKKELDTSAVGFQPPLPKDEVKPLGEFGYGGEGSPVSRGRGHGGRGRGRAYGNYDGDDTADYGDGSWDNKGRGYGRGGYFRGRGRGFRGKGGYGGQPDFQQETNGNDNEGSIPVRGRGRGRGRGQTRGWGRNSQLNGLIHAGAVGA